MSLKQAKVKNATRFFIQIPPTLVTKITKSLCTFKVYVFAMIKAVQRAFVHKVVYELYEKQKETGDRKIIR